MTSVIMDSPALQSSSSHPSRLRHNSSFSNHATAVDPRGAIQKRHSSSNALSDRNRSISVTQADRLYRLAAEQQHQQQSEYQLPHQHHDSIAPAALGVQYFTPQHSPQLSGFAAQPSIEPFPQWTAPTPPRSDSGIPNVSIDSDEPVTTGISGTQEFAFEQPASSAEMSSLGFLLPTQYGASPYDTEPSSYAPMDQNYIPPMRQSQPPSTSGAPAYSQTASSNPELYQSRGSDASRRPSEMPPTTSSGSPYAQDYRRTSNPYEGGYSVTTSQTIPSISGLTHSPHPSPHMGSTGPQYSRSPSMYESNMYGPAYTTAPPSQQMYAPSGSSYTQPPSFGSSGDKAVGSSDSSIRVLNQRPKPQCWEHGCNGRQFSTFSNLLRHQREKSGTAAKSYCPKCGAEFTRTTARNGHLQHDKCTKQRRSSDGK